ncbi:glycosyltransferase family 2 protein [Gelidibacter salicanalis]|uniref:Glycosyltransferase family 2 protein n=1 Tax=Gelidibacter salicanalis TaxID=291193 RepID=A0A5C7ABR7_9FLAO|nr:glycosyltransferase family A protein [Gelidibacter salicanalis]TXE05841.1 glycosyltransferase family 2 protein [Gelidibacter salicanalis]
MDNSVSVIMPTFNRAHFILYTLQSFMNQSFKNWEIILIDDGSTDNTKHIIENIKDYRIKYFIRSKEYTKGPCGCRNMGIDNALHDYILFFDDDDIAHPKLLEYSMNAFDQYEEIDFCNYGRSVFYNDSELQFKLDNSYKITTIAEEDYYKIIANILPFNTCAVVWKRTAIGSERFNETLIYSDEWEYFQRLLSNGLSGIKLEMDLIFARKHSNSSTARFLNKDSVYYKSTVRARKLAIVNLGEKLLLNKDLFKYFLNQSIILKDKSILMLTMEYYRMKSFQTFFYSIGYDIYPMLKAYYKIKSKIVRNYNNSRII